MSQLVCKRKRVKGIDKTRTEAQLVQLGSIAFGVRYILYSQGVKLIRVKRGVAVG